MCPERQRLIDEYDVIVRAFYARSQAYSSSVDGFRERLLHDAQTGKILADAARAAIDLHIATHGCGEQTKECGAGQL